MANTTPTPESVDLDADDICSDPFEEGCTASLDDGEGWDGACGNCADRQFAKEEGRGRPEGEVRPEAAKITLVRVDQLNYLLVSREHAPDELGTSAPKGSDTSDQTVTHPWALFLGEENDGLIIEGDLDAIADRLGDIARYVSTLRGQQRR